MSFRSSYILKDMVSSLEEYAILSSWSTWPRTTQVDSFPCFPLFSWRTLIHHCLRWSCSLHQCRRCSRIFTHSPPFISFSFFFSFDFGTASRKFLAAIGHRTVLGCQNCLFVSQTVNGKQNYYGCQPATKRDDQHLREAMNVYSRMVKLKAKQTDLQQFIRDHGVRYVID